MRALDEQTQMLSINTFETIYSDGQAQEGDVSLFLSRETARELVACVAGFLGLRVEEPLETPERPRDLP